MSNSYEGPPITYAGKTYPVTITRGGLFTTDAGGRNLSDYTLGGLTDQVKRATARVKARISVPFMKTGWRRFHGDERQYWTATVTGQNARTLGYTVTNADGYGSRAEERFLPTYAMSVLDADGQAEWGRLLDAKREAEKALSAFEKEHQFKLSQAVEAALAEASKEGLA